MSEPRTDLRDLPAVESLESWPSRASQTLLAKFDTCPRSAYLYAKYRGGSPGHPLDRGTLIHAVIERMTLDLLAAGESSYIAPAFTQGRFGEVIPEDPALAAKQIASLTAAVVDEVYRENPELVVPVGDVDAVRVMAYHWALGFAIDPEKVVAVERTFALELDGHQVIGRIDLASLADDVGDVVDYKSQLAVPDQEAYEKGFQAKLYALLVVFGQPAEQVHCGDCNGAGCHECGGRGYVLRLEDPIGERVQWVRTREVYPRYLRDDGELQARSAILSRTDLADFREDVRRLLARMDLAREAWKFPAVSGSHCTYCPCEPECPLPKHLRRWAGAINDMAAAAEAAEWADRMDSQVSATKEELKRFASAHGPVRYGGDMVREFVLVESRAVKKRGSKADWEGLEAAVREAAAFGTPFDLGEWIVSRPSMSFKKRKLTPGEVEAEKPAVPEKDFGDVPF